MWGILCFFASAAFAQVPNPDSIQPVPSNYSFLDPYFTKYLNIFGVNIFAEDKVSDWMVSHAGHIMAQYLDFDATGSPSNSKMLKSMLRQKATLVMFYDPDSRNANKAFRQLDRHGMTGQDLDYEDIPDWVPHTYRVLTAKDVNPCFHPESQNCVQGWGADDFDASLEEILHLITDTGYSETYPDQFATEAGSVLMNTMDDMIADCGWAFNRTFVYPKCSGKYHYSDWTCDYECLGTEYFMWSLTSLLGGQDGSHNDATAPRCGDIMNEWEMCTPELLKQYDPMVVALYSLENGNPWLLPNVLPDGNYQPKTNSSFWGHD